MTERDGDTEKGCQKPAVQQKPADDDDDDDDDSHTYRWNIVRQAVSLSCIVY